MTNSNSIRAGLVILIAFALAIWLGVSIVTNQGETIIKVGAALLILTCVFLGRKIWLLLIFFTALNVPLIRGFSTIELGQVLFIGFTFAIVLLRRQPFNFKLGEKEFWMLALAAMVLQTYLRNPVGLNMFGADSVGARPYFVVTLAFVSSMILGNVPVRTEEIKLFFKLSILGSFLGIGLTSLRMRGATSVGFEQGRFGDDTGAARIGSLGSLGNAIAQFVASFKSPLIGLFHPFWGILILASLILAAMSGFRNAIAGVGLIYLVGMAYRGGFPSVLISVVGGSVFLSVLAVVNSTSPLPGNIQRALSPFPGTWEQKYREAAESSTEWRVEMWKEALLTEYWIRNKLLGDGLGFSRRELLLLESIKLNDTLGQGTSGSGMTIQQEGMMISGGYHSGPVQTVRTVGYVGLIVLLAAMVRIAVHAHRQIIRCRGTEWYPIALFIGVPAIVLPIFFTFIFGEFGKDVSALFLSYGMISLLEKNLPLPPYVKRTHVPYILKKRLAGEQKA